MAREALLVLDELARYSENMARCEMAAKDVMSALCRHTSLATCLQAIDFMETNRVPFTDAAVETLLTSLDSMDAQKELVKELVGEADKLRSDYRVKLLYRLRRQVGSILVDFFNLDQVVILVKALARLPNRDRPRVICTRLVSELFSLCDNNVRFECLKTYLVEFDVKTFSKLNLIDLLVFVPGRRDEVNTVRDDLLNYIFGAFEMSITSYDIAFMYVVSGLFNLPKSKKRIRLAKIGRQEFNEVDQLIQGYSQTLKRYLDTEPM